MLVKLRGNIGDTISYHKDLMGLIESTIVYVEITVFEDRYDAQYILKNGDKVPLKCVADIQHRPVKDIEVLDTID